MHTKIKVFQRILVVLLWLAAVAGIMLLFERFRTLGGTLLASAGVVSILIGLSAQKTFAAIIAGIQVALFHPINLDDVVVLEGEWGHHRGNHIQLRSRENMGFTSPGCAGYVLFGKALSELDQDKR